MVCDQPLLLMLEHGHIVMLDHGHYVTLLRICVTMSLGVPTVCSNIVGFHKFDIHIEDLLHNGPAPVPNISNTFFTG